MEECLTAETDANNREASDDGSHRLCSRSYDRPDAAAGHTEDQGPLATVEISDLADWRTEDDIQDVDDGAEPSPFAVAIEEGIDAVSQ